MDEIFLNNNTDFDHLCNQYAKYQSYYDKMHKKYLSQINILVQETCYSELEYQVPIQFYYFALFMLTKFYVDMYDQYQIRFPLFNIYEWGDFGIYLPTFHLKIGFFWEYEGFPGDGTLYIGNTIYEFDLSRDNLILSNELQTLLRDVCMPFLDSTKNDLL